MFGTLLVLLGLGVIQAPIPGPSVPWAKFFAILLLIVICLIVGWGDIQLQLSR